jgi:tRNA pseudouridine38/39 synthase
MVDTIPKKKPRIKRHNEGEDIDFTKMSSDELIFEIKRLKAHNKQLKVLLEQATTDKNAQEKKYYDNRPFDHTKYHKRHVLLKFAYLGWDYNVIE